MIDDDTPEGASVKWTRTDTKTTENLLNDYWSNISRDQEPEHPNSDNARNTICNTVRAFMNKAGLGFSNEDLDTLSSTVTADEIWESIDMMPQGSAPGRG